MVLTEEQQRWCADRLLGYGFDDDDEDKVQYTHICEYVGGDGDAPRPVLPKHMTRKKLVRARRARNAWARKLSVSIGRRPRTIWGKDGVTGEPASLVLEKGPHDTAHYWRGRDNESPQYETKRPHHSPYCDGCFKWLGGRGRGSSVHGAYWRTLRYCAYCQRSGVSARDYERRAAAKAYRKQPTAHAPQRSVAICRSPRLWCGDAGQRWPALDEDADAAERARRSEQWADVTCVDCLRILRERGCPGIEEIR